MTIDNYPQVHQRCSQTGRRSTNNEKNRRATFDIHRQSQVNATSYLLTVSINAQCQQTWPTSTFNNQHSAIIGDQKHYTHNIKDCK